MAAGRPGRAAWLHTFGADLCSLPLSLPQFPFLGWLANTSTLIYLGDESSSAYQWYVLDAKAEQFRGKTRAEESYFLLLKALHANFICGILVATLLYWLGLKGV